MIGDPSISNITTNSDPFMSAQMISDDQMAIQTGMNALILAPILPWVMLSNNALLEVNKGYAIAGYSLLLLTLPVGINGDQIVLCNYTSPGYKLQQPQATDYIQVGDKQTTLGLTGAIQSTTIGDCVQLTKINNRWLGNILQGTINLL